MPHIGAGSKGDALLDIPSRPRPLKLQQPHSQAPKKKSHLRRLFSNKDQNNAGEKQETNSENSPISINAELAKKKLFEGQNIEASQLGFTNEKTFSRENEQLRSQIAMLLEGKEKWKVKFKNLDADYERVRGELQHVSKKLEDKENDHKEADADMKRKNHELRQVRLQFEEEKKKWERLTKPEQEMRQEIQELESNLKTVSEKRHKYYEQAQIERSRAEQLTIQHEEIEAQFEEANKALEIKTMELSTMESHYRDLQRIHDAARDELAIMKIESRRTLDDQFFLEYWQHLQREVRRWAETYFWTGAKKSKWVGARTEDQPIVSPKLLVLSPDCRDLLYKSEDGSGRALVAEAYIWKIIENKILDGNPKSFSQGLFWAHNLRGELCNMEKFLRPGEEATDSELRMFHKWKASTAKLLISRLEPPSDSYRIPVDDDVFNYIIGRILGVLDSSLITSEADLPSCISTLRGILHSAIEFDAYLNEQWSLVYPLAMPPGYNERHSFPFNSENMEPVNDVHISEGEQVGLVVSPALVRKGTANGDKYDKVELIAKSRVLPQGFLSSTQKS